MFLKNSKLDPDPDLGQKTLSQQPSILIFSFWQENLQMKHTQKKGRFRV